MKSEPAVLRVVEEFFKARDRLLDLVPVIHFLSWHLMLPAAGDGWNANVSLDRRCPRAAVWCTVTYHCSVI